MSESESLLRNDFTNYERTVWVVNCIEGHLRRYYSDLLICFDRYPELPQQSGVPLTPDFTVVFKGPYEIVAEVKRALGRDPLQIQERYTQLKNYDRQLKLRVTSGGSCTHETDRHDLLLFINVEHATKETRILQGLLAQDRARGLLNRAVSVFSATNDTQQGRARWIFNWVHTYSDPLKDVMLPPDNRLSTRHQTEHNPIVVYPDDFTPLQATHYFCNDDPPDIYVAVLLWSRVFPRLIPQERREQWIDNNCQGPVEIQVDPGELAEIAKPLFNYTIRTALVRRVLGLLVGGKLAERAGNGSFKVLYRRLRVSPEQNDAEEDLLEVKLDRVREALIRALARGAKAQQPKASHRRKTRPSRDTGQLSFSWTQ